MRILLVDDDASIANSLKDELSRRYLVDVAYTGQDGRNFALSHDYDLIILDWMLPDLDGVEVCKNLRADFIQSPILMITAKTGLENLKSALDAGADDYLNKPFHLAELQARTRSLLRRKTKVWQADILIVGSLVLNPALRRVCKNYQPIMLTRKEFDLLEYLMLNQGQPLSREMIFENVWGLRADIHNLSNLVNVGICHLRSKIDRPFGSHQVRTVFGVGYKIEV